MTKYFKEIDCGNMDQDFLLKLDKANEMAEIPFKINSAFRTPEHNIKIGIADTFTHVDDDKEKVGEVVWTY